MLFITRKQWGASKGEPLTSLASTKGVKVHYVGSQVHSALHGDHGLCGALVRQIQTTHMHANGWSDIGYTALVCPHGYVYEGRGLNKLPAANGEGLNSGHYAVCGLVGSSGLMIPTDQMFNGIRDAIEWLHAKGRAGSEIKCHKDGYATSCPGPYLTDWVRRGAPRMDDDMATAKQIWDEPIDTGDGEKPWRARSVLGNIEKDQDRTNQMVEALLLSHTALVETVGSLVKKIESLQ